MFSIHLIEILQSIDSSALVVFMRFVSNLAMIPILLTFVLGMLFGFDFKRGIMVLNVLAWTALFTNVLKQEINYPRPGDISTTVKHQVIAPDAHIVNEESQAIGFFECIPESILKVNRNDELFRFGFPSGHSSTQTALWLSIILLFNRPIYRALGISIIVLTMFSRMYLGYHFLGDVLAGCLLGVIVCLLLLRWIKDSRFLVLRTHTYKSLSFLAFPLILIPFIGSIPIEQVGSLMGINLAVFFQLQWYNTPKNVGEGPRRLLTAGLGSFIFLLGFYLPNLLGFRLEGFLGLFIAMAISLLSVVGSLRAFRLLNLFRS